jgi:hypothetical protein
MATSGEGSRGGKVIGGEVAGPKLENNLFNTALVGIGAGKFAAPGVRKLGAVVAAADAPTRFSRKLRLVNRGLKTTGNVTSAKFGKRNLNPFKKDT